MMANVVRGFLVALMTLTAPVTAMAATVFSFPNFNSCAGLQLNGAAACTGGILRLNPATFGQAGSTFSTSTVSLGPGATFSTFFAFQMTNPGGSDNDGPGADGITFTVQPVSSTVGGGGGGIGYAGIPTSLAVELDTWNNGLPTDSDGNHVGVDLNGSVVSVARAAVSTRMNNGAVWYAWIDYNGSAVEVRVAQTNSRPASPTLSYAVNLASVLGTTNAFVGFTSGTGAAFETHDILQWQLNDTFSPIGATTAATVPTLSELSLLLLALAVAGTAFARARV